MHAANGLRFDANLKWLFTELPFEQRFDAAAAAGFTGVEYPAPYAYPAAELRRRLADAGLRQVLINTPSGPAGSPERAGFACLPGRVADFRAGIERGLEYAVALESQFLHVMGGARPAGVSHDRAYAQYVVNIAWAAERARDTGVRLLLEAQNKRDVPGMVLDNQAQAAAVVDAIGSAAVGLLFDIYHVQIDEGDLVHRLREFLPRIFHVQIADPPDRSEPGSGEIAWPTVFGALRDGDYGGWIGCEYRPAKDTLSGLGWIAELAR
ncbi:hydroxypyruvate isomerase family protein [Fodinicola acaciae]|uniref:hydroxypyruvate isomerase family protein n=1 Tax=Fodinicola acaciae TaxID=2681555 RepID=UPI0013D7D0B6|nr:TIM barrel protein [Fodinicola acaciae]